jgi:hippurate hydrolase
VIPDKATFEATVRTFSAESLARVQDRSVRLCTQIAAAHGLQAEVSFTGEYPVTINDPDHANFALEVAADVFGPDRARKLADPVMGSEDFSRVLAEVPGAFVFLGACTGDDPATAPTNHSALARFDDSVLPDAALLLTELARRRLDQINPDRAPPC